MYISSREKMIIEKLLEKNQKITIKKLAEEIDVSPRTIHRDLSGIESYLATHQLELARKTGAGIQIIGAVQNKELLKRKLMTVTLQDYMADERQTLILCTLYEASGPVKLFTLANELYVTVATISNDLLKLEEKLDPFNLSILRKRGYGVELVGSEEAKRRAISYSISQTLSEDEFLSLIKRSIQRKTAVQENAISERLLHLVNREKLLIIEDVIRDLNDQTISSMTDSAYVGLIVHIALAIDRIQRGEKIEMAQDFLQQLQEEREYKVAEKIIQYLASRLKIHIPDAEIGYITMHLQGAKFRHEERDLDATDLQVTIQAKKLIREVEMLTNSKLSSNAALLEGLITHLRPALYRIQQRMVITNPLLSSIRRDYEELFQVVRNACEKVFAEMNIPDEEIGFLVLHFGAAILGLNKEGGLTAYVVCSSGIGTSKMLSTQLRREIREIEEVRNVSAFELNELEIADRDLIISTIHLPDFPKEYILVSPFLTEQEIQQIHLYTKRKLLLEPIEEQAKESISNVEEITNRIQKIHLYAGTITTILKDFQLTRESVQPPLNELMQHICSELEIKGVVNHANSVTKALFEREAIGGLGIPDTKLALFHTKNEHVLKPSFTMHTLREPIITKAMDNSNIEVTNILLMLSPDPFHEPGLEILSFVSSVIIEDEESIRLFESGNAQLIHAYLAEKFEQFMNKI